MGRIKRGLDYFPMSTGFIHDRMVRRVMKHEGDSAFVTLVETLSYIYAGKGYYISADDEFYDELADNLYNADIDDVKRVIVLAVKYGLFDAGLFEQYNILTSADIQRQYLFITKRRSCSLIAPEYCLLETEELASLRASRNSKADIDSETTKDVALSADDVTSESENETSGTQNKRKKTKENEMKIDNLPNPPRGGDEEGDNLKKRKVVTQEDIDRMQAPNDGVQRNYQGLVESLRLFNIPPSEQYAIILKSNFGAIGGPVWKGFGTIRGSNGKIKLPGHYLLSVIN